MERVDLSEILRPIAVLDAGAGHPDGCCTVYEKDVPLEHLEAVAEWAAERRWAFEPGAPESEPRWYVPRAALGL